MKIKAFNKKLALNKETVTNLNPREMIAVNGGIFTAKCNPTGIAACPSELSTCCPH